MSERMRLPKALSASDLKRKVVQLLPFEGEWEAAFGTPERRGTWLIFGESGSGKTEFVLQLAKELSRWGKVALNSREQGVSLSMLRAMERNKMEEVGKRFCLLNEDMDTLSERLTRKQSPDFVIIDSLQYTGLNYREYIAFKDRHPDKLFVFVSHAEGKHPEGRTARKVQYDAEVKILVEGYRAYCKGRFVPSPGTYYTIWAEGAARVWLDQTDTKTEQPN